MKISIVTLSFNQGAYLRQAIDSLLLQGYEGLEHIVVDPGSTDGSRKIIEAYKDRIAHVIFEKDLGASDGLNKGFALATGDIFGFLNADDILLPGSLTRVVDYFDRNPQIDVVMGNGFIIDADGKRTKHIRARQFTIHRHFHAGTAWMQQSTFFRREVYLRSPRFNLNNRTSWDGELFVRMLHQGARLGYIHADLSCFRIYETSITGSGTNHVAYQGDRRRLFREIYGCDWGWKNELTKFLYRAEGVLHRGLHRLADRFAVENNR